MAASRGAPAVEFGSAPFAISVSEHYDTGEFQHSCKDPKMAFPQLSFQGPLSQVIVVDNTSGRIENERYPVGLFTADLLF